MPLLFEIELGGPIGFHVLFSRQHLAIRTIDHIEEPIFGCMYRSLYIFTINIKIGKNDIHIRVIVPSIAGGCLDMPLILTSVSIKRHNRTQKQVVTAFRATNFSIPGRSITGTKYDLVKFLIICPCVPGVTTTTVLPPFPGPGFSRHFHRFVFKTISRVTRNKVPAPELLTGLSIISRYKTTRGTYFRAAIANKQLAIKCFDMTGNVQL